MLISNDVRIISDDVRLRMNLDDVNGILRNLLRLCRNVMTVFVLDDLNDDGDDLRYVRFELADFINGRVLYVKRDHDGRLPRGLCILNARSRLNTDPPNATAVNMARIVTSAGT